MLTISRKVGESIVIEPAEAIDPTATVGELLRDWQIEITVAEQMDGHTGLIVKAPKAINVRRKELATGPDEAV